MKSKAAQQASTRKAELLIDSAHYRAGLVQARTAVIDGLRPESLVQSVVEHAIGVAGARFGTSFMQTGIRYSAVMPIAAAALSFLFRQRFRNLAIGAGIAAIAAAAVARRDRR